MPKKLKGDPLVSPGIVCYAEKEEKPFWFSSLGQMIQFGTMKFCRSFKNYFGQFVWIEKNSQYNSRDSLHEAPTKNSHCNSRAFFLKGKSADQKQLFKLADYFVFYYSYASPSYDLFCKFTIPALAWANNTGTSQVSATVKAQKVKSIMTMLSVAFNKFS